MHKYNVVKSPVLVTQHKPVSDLVVVQAAFPGHNAPSFASQTDQEFGSETVTQAPRRVVNPLPPNADYADHGNGFTFWNQLAQFRYYK